MPDSTAGLVSYSGFQPDPSHVVTFLLARKPVDDSSSSTATKATTVLLLVVLLKFVVLRTNLKALQESIVTSSSLRPAGPASDEVPLRLPVAVAQFLTLAVRA